LPRALERIVAGSVGIETTASAQQILSLVRGHDEEMREREDRVLVEELIDRAASGRNAALGWDETLQALAEGRVHMLVLPDAAARPGVLCMQEHFLATSGPNDCPICGEPLTTIADVAEAAIRTAMHTDSLVRFLAPGAAALLESRGAAASLRY
jgi:peptide subunit release factor 1 (eRF1)